MPRRHWQLRIADMLDAAETAVRLTKDLDQEAFFSDRVLVDAVIRDDLPALIPSLRRVLEIGDAGLPG